MTAKLLRLSQKSHWKLVFLLSLLFAMELTSLESSTSKSIASRCREDQVFRLNFSRPARISTAASVNTGRRPFFSLSLVIDSTTQEEADAVHRA